MSGTKRTKTDPFYQSDDWKGLRRLALARAGYCCEWCGASVREKFSGRVDHIQTRAEAPQLALVLENLRVLCNDCDAKRHAEKGGGKPRIPVGLDGYPE